MPYDNPGRSPQGRAVFHLEPVRNGSRFQRRWKRSLHRGERLFTYSILATLQLWTPVDVTVDTDKHHEQKSWFGFVFFTCSLFYSYSYSSLIVSPASTWTGFIRPTNDHLNSPPTVGALTPAVYLFLSPDVWVNKRHSHLPGHTERERERNYKDDMCVFVIYCMSDLKDNMVCVCVCQQ